MSELQRQQQKLRERREALYGKPKVANITVKPKIELVASEPKIVKEEFIQGPIEKPQTATKYIKWMASQSPYSYEEILSRKRFRDIVRYRSAMIIAVYESYPNLSFPQMGRLFNRDHTTVLHHVGKTAKAKLIKWRLKMNEAPKKIYAKTVWTDGGWDSGSWSNNDNNAKGVEYVRAYLFNRYYSYLDAIETECSFAVDPENYTHEDVVKLIGSLWNVLGLAKTALNEGEKE